MTSKIKLVAFDLDDCLFDSSGLSERARIKGIDQMITLGLKIERAKAIKTIQEIVKEYGSNSSEHYNLFIRRLNHFNISNISYIDEIKFITAAVMAYHEEKIKSITLFDDVLPCLQKIKEKGIQTAIITDGVPTKQYEKILRLEIENLIDLVVISDEIGIRKPNPQLFEYCLNKLAVKGSESIYIGDRIDKDIIPALLNNMNSVYIHREGKYDTNITGDKIPNETKPDFEISNLDEIFEIIDEINNK